jgi:6-phosphogluconate dehydrogenase
MHHSVRIGFIGLGAMGSRMAKRLLDQQFDVIGYDPYSCAPVPRVSEMHEYRNELPRRRVLMMMVQPSAVDTAITQIAPHLEQDDIIIDGSNSHYRASEQRAASLKERGICFLDAGISGGLPGAVSGASLMVGGDEEAARYCEPLFNALAAPAGYAHIGPSGAGHYAKIVHNGILYGMLESIGEGASLIDKGPYDIDLETIFGIWNHAVIRSYLVSLLHENCGMITHANTEVGDTGSGQWAAETALQYQIPAPVISTAVHARRQSRGRDHLGNKVISLLRHKFGGHAL